MEARLLFLVGAPDLCQERLLNEDDVSKTKPFLRLAPCQFKLHRKLC